MTDIVTPVLGLELPDVGSDDNVWGDILNRDLQAIDQKVLPLTGGTVTGTLQVHNADLHVTGTGYNIYALSGAVYAERLFATTLTRGGFVGSWLQGQNYATGFYTDDAGVMHLSTGVTSVGAALPAQDFATVAVNGTTTFHKPVLLPGDPTAPLGAATKQYVDARAAAGGGGTGAAGSSWDGGASVWDGGASVWDRRADAIMDVRDYGALGDGVTDDTSAIQNTINAAAGKARVYIPPVASCYLVRGLTLPSNSYLLLDGLLKLIDHAQVTILTATGAANVTIEGNGGLHGNRANQTPNVWPSISGIEILTCTDVVVRGITITEANTHPIDVIDTVGCLLDGLTLTNSSNSPEFVNNSRNCWARNLYIEGINDEGWAFYGGVRNSGITNSIITGSTAAGISLLNDGGAVDPAHDIVISGNILYGNQLSGIEINTGTAGGGGSGLPHTDITITGNRLHGNAQLTGVGQLHSIYMNFVTGVTLTGNTIGSGGNQSAGCIGIMAEYAATRLTITGNTISNEGRGSTNGIGIKLNTSHALVSGNHIYDDQATHTMAYAITGANGPGINIIGNRISGMLNNPAINLDTPGGSTIVVEHHEDGSTTSYSPNYFNTLNCDSLHSTGNILADVGVFAANQYFGLYGAGGNYLLGWGVSGYYDHFDPATGVRHWKVPSGDRMTLDNAGTLTVIGSVFAGGVVEVGSTSVAGPTFVDFHSSGNNIDYDARIIATGGTGSVGQGNLMVQGASLTVQAPLTAAGIASTGSQTLPLPAAKTGTSYTVANTDCSLVLTPSGTFTLTLPAASASAGRIIRLKSTAAFAVNSASANIVQLVGGAATAAILSATAGKWCLLQSDGSNWHIMQAG